VTKFLQNDLSVSKFLGTASTRFLETNDITVTKFLDVTVTKFLASNETAITKYLEANDVSVTKFLEMVISNFLLDSQAVENLLEENEISITKFMDTDKDGIAVTKYLDGTPTYTTQQQNGTDKNVNMTIIQFLEQFLHEQPEHIPGYDHHNDVSVTKFLSDANVSQQMQNGQQMNIIQFLQDNDISVTKFLDWLN